jgi:hypothetical protein
MRVKVKYNGSYGEREVENCEYVNREEWFGKTWLIEIGGSYVSLFFVVEADYESAAIDELVDSEWGHLLKTDEQCLYCENMNYENCECSFAGNYSERVDLDYVMVYRCEVVL